jgi:hypothetical protein
MIVLNKYHMARFKLMNIYNHIYLNHEVHPDFHGAAYPAVRSAARAQQRK